MGKRQRIVVRWAAPKHLTALAAFIAAISLLEAILAAYFWSKGITDLVILLLPPIGVVIALTFSWAYLTEQIAFIPQKVKAKEKRGRRSFFGLGNFPSILPSSGIPRKITVRSSVIVLVTFLIPFGAIYILTSQWVAQFFASLEPIAEIEVIWKYVLLQDVSALIAGMATLLIGHRGL
jgi:hypothetical protein